MDDRRPATEIGPNYMSQIARPGVNRDERDHPLEAYGRFEAEGREFVITNPRPPRPWTNIIANPRVGLAVSQSGSGFSWVDNSQLAVLTRWEQDLARDSSGKFLYLRDVDSAKLWSLSPAPVWPAYDRYECRHGLGYTTFTTEFAGIRASWTLFAHASDTIELWRVELTNLSERTRRLELTSFLEWCCGVAPSPRREFHKLFIETEFSSQRRAIFAWNHMWEAPSERYGHWNTDFPYISAFASTETILSAQGDKSAFIGQYGDYAAPKALAEDPWTIHFGRHEDPVAVLRSALELQRGESRVVGFALAVSQTRSEVERLLDRRLSTEMIDRALEETRAGWRERLSAHRIDTPDASVNWLVNDWVRYQAISARIWGRAGYYQQSGAYGFRDQLQDSQVWLTIEPQRCREQLSLHASHQFADGSVYHWWHPLTEQGHITKMTDDLLWLAFVAANYIRETGDASVLRDRNPFIDSKEPVELLEHIRRAFQRVFQRTSPRGLPYIGAGDWNDGLSACGLQERGESIWLAEFLAGLLADWAVIYEKHVDQALWPDAGNPTTAHPTRGKEIAADCLRRREALVNAINTHAWDGNWYFRATLDDGSIIGSARNRAGQIFLNAQTWAILNDIAPPERAAKCMAAVRERLAHESGALLLAPAYDTPAREVGYITRYAPGLRENGGVYTHAATWAIAAACKARDSELVDRLLTAINPANKNPARYWAEPYVLPGNVDGPESPYCGRAGWTWYTGSAQWLHRIVTQWVLGVRPEWDGLRIDPCLPPSWRGATMTRPWRGNTYRFEFERVAKPTAGAEIEITLDGLRLPTNVIPTSVESGKRRHVRVRFS